MRLVIVKVPVDAGTIYGKSKCCALSFLLKRVQSLRCMGYVDAFCPR